MIASYLPRYVYARLLLLIAIIGLVEMDEIDEMRLDEIFIIIM